VNEAIVTTSWDDGHPSDLKLAELLREYDVPATFYIPIDNLERRSMTPPKKSERLLKALMLAGTPTIM